jgi:hypothetical protein
MLIIRVSQLTGVTHAVDIEVNAWQIKLWLDGMAIQQAMPELTATEREFILTGITDEEWVEAFNLGRMEQERDD